MWVGSVNQLRKAEKKRVLEIISFLIRASQPKFSLQFPWYFCLWLLPRSLQLPRGHLPGGLSSSGSALHDAGPLRVRRAHPRRREWMLQAEQRNWTRRWGGGVAAEAGLENI